MREEPAWDSLGRPRDKLFLVGRDKELRALASALQLADDGHTVVVHVHGPSGMGKTALVERFLESTRTTRRVSIAAGRCYERESVPYKAFDSLVDSLGAQLQQLSDAERRATLPEHMLELAQLFPVLKPFAPTAVSAPKESAQPNVQEARARAMRALKQLLGRLANRSRLVLFIDDLQWSDSDSNVILGELMGPPASVPMLLICAYRSDPTVAPALLQAHRQSASTHPASLRVVDVPLASLEAADAALLVRALAENTGTEEEVRSIAVESGGLPLFIEELARRASTQRPSPAGLDGEMSLDRMILARVATLPEGARKLLEVIAVAGHPVAQGIAAVASEIEGGLNAGLTLLRSSHLARGLGFRNEDTIEAYHDRIRESVASSLSARAAAEIHFKLARAIEATDGADPEVLATHYFGAGVRDKAKLYAVEAAHRAGRAMAFDRAAELYKQALDCVPGDRLLTVRRAEALVNAGRSAEAAPLYLDAAGQLDQPDVERSELQRRAAEQLLVSGRIRGGVSLLRPLLEAVGLRYPSSPQRALFGIIARMTQMDLSSFRYLDRSPEEVPEFERRRIDLSWTAGKGLGSVDIMRGGYFIVRSTQLALRGGDSHRIARGLAHVGLFTAAQGRKKAIEKGLRLISEAEHIGRKLDDPHLIGFAKINAGTAYMTLSEWARAHEQLQEGVRLLEAHCTGVSWETSFAHVVSSNVLRFLGQIRDLEELGSEWQRIADSRGDLYGGVWIRLHTSTPLLAAGNAVAAYESIDSAMREWSTDLFTPQHLVAAFLATECDLYTDQPEQAYQRMRQAWVAAKKSFAMGWQNNLIQALHARAAAALAWAEAQPARRPALLAEVRDAAKRLTRIDRDYSLGSASLLLAGVAQLAGQQEECLRELNLASSRFTAASMLVHAAVASRCMGKLRGGETGRDAVARADSLLHQQRIQSPGRWTAVHAPGFA
ncbi:MAG TPA: AAA family ATPase, partial [Polyangiaceae bacterium]|nr:AAA family ATPase [Polyangiaceae bacterium]